MNMSPPENRTCGKCGATIEVHSEDSPTELVVDHYAEEHGLGVDED